MEAFFPRRRYALRDDQWERIKEMLPGSAAWVEATAKDNRLFVDAGLSVVELKTRDSRALLMLRIPVPLLEKLDAELNKGIINKEAHPWILEAIVEKLQRCGDMES